MALQEILAVVSATVLLSASGALAPGPLSASAVAVGTRYGVVGGLLVALGHALVELPYVLGLVSLQAAITSIARSIGAGMAVAASAFMLYFAYLTLKAAKQGLRAKGVNLNPLLVGVVLTGLNPHFLLWWVSVGYPILSYMSLGEGIAVLVYASHVSLDIAWLSLLAYLGAASAKLLSSRGYAWLMRSLAAMLVVFAVDVSLEAVTGVGLLPF
jgi:threonine/homoserine/homoserine lactone efflux protein